jgi:hypothetical protein
MVLGPTDYPEWPHGGARMHDRLGHRRPPRCDGSRPARRLTTSRRSLTLGHHDALPPSRELRVELTAARSGAENRTIRLEKKEQIKERLGARRTWVTRVQGF